MHYWIDGYNLLFRVPANHSKHCSFQEKRKNIIIELNDYVKTLGLHVTVVFDSSDPSNDPIRRSHYDALEIVYTAPKTSADDLLLTIARGTDEPQLLCIVTSDLELAKKIKLLQIQTQPLEHFLSFVQKKRAKQHSYHDSSKDIEDSPLDKKRLQDIFEKKERDFFMQKSPHKKQS